MRIIEKLSPTGEIMSKLSYRDQQKVSVLLTGNFFCVLMFLVFSIALLVTGKLGTGIFMLVLSFLFFVSMLIIKKGKIVLGSYVTTIGLVSSCVIIALFTSYTNHPVVTYRLGCFCLAITTLNYMISFKKGQMYVFFVLSLILQVVHIFVRYPGFLNSSDSSRWISDLIINFVAIITGNLILIASSKSNDKIVDHSEIEHKQVSENLEKMTNVLTQFRQSLDVSQKLNGAADSATLSVEAIQEVYQTLINDTENLNSQSNNVNASSQVVNEKAKFMYDGIQDQNQSLTQINSAVVEISSNISNISDIARKRHEGMQEATKLLDTQVGLISNIVSDVAKVEESSSKIAEFVKTVDSIAQQTNLLAMNASIEAAHAGENGKGFGVIAQEIRKLSEETANNAKKISDTLQINTQIVRETTESVSAFTEVNNKSATEIRENFNSLEVILQGITQMEYESQDINNSVNKVVHVADENTKIIDEVVKQIETQKNGVENISNGLTSLQERVAFISEMLPQISEAIVAIHESSKENENVSARISELLK